MADSPHAASPVPVTEEDSLAPHTTIAGYVIEGELGRGGMGTVYLARQLSLGRHVALKVMSRRWAQDPAFVARFTREAYAAAQLCHPNIVQIYDIGECDGFRFFSMEYVRGQSLADLVRHRGKLDAEVAVAYVLQAARGLKHAHEHGMIHRDVKPDNLLLDENGLVKIADLGLVKTGRGGDGQASSDPLIGSSGIAGDLTETRIALGTPAYMSPEQCRDASTVDHRADIYSLGCTLYVLVTGRTPYDGSTAVAVMSQHAYNPLVPPDRVAERVPKELSSIIQRMMAKDPAERYQSMAEVIRELEAWLGVRQPGTFSPAEEQIARLETLSQQFRTVPAAVLRRQVMTGAAAVTALAALLLAFFGQPDRAFGLLGLVAHGGLAYFILDGLANKRYFFTRVRQFLFELSAYDWLIALLAVGLFFILLAKLQVLWSWLGFGVIGTGLAVAAHFVLDPLVDEQRRPIVASAVRLLRELRAQGIDEEQLRHFVARYAGRDWEEFFEVLFGYEAKLTERVYLARGGSGGGRAKYATWRDPLIAWMNTVEQSRRTTRERQLLEEVERARLLAGGETVEAAGSQARAAAEAVVAAAGRIRDARLYGTIAGPMLNLNGSQGVSPSQRTMPGRSEPDHSSCVACIVSRLAGVLFGTPVRVAAAAIMLAGCVLWIVQTERILHWDEAAWASENPSPETTGQVVELPTGTMTAPSPRVLVVPGLPTPLVSWVTGWNVGVAGMLLLASLFYRGHVMAALALLGAVVVAVGHHHGVRGVDPLRAEHVSLLLGGLLCLIGFRLSDP